MLEVEETETAALEGDAMTAIKQANMQWLENAKGPLTPDEARLLMRLMDGALSGDHVALMGRLSEGILYAKLKKITARPASHEGALMSESMADKAKRMGKSHFRGHPIWWSEEDQIWRYSDNNEPIPQGGGEARPCLKCGQKEWSGDGAVDACLGELPGVTSACCGHGEPEGAYVCFKGGVVLRGFTVERSALQEND